jgi:hypothetical protein
LALGYVIGTLRHNVATKKKNSLVANINRRKKRGTSRPKSKSTVSKKAYKRMQEGWPKKGKSRKRKRSKKKSRA